MNLNEGERVYSRKHCGGYIMGDMMIAVWFLCLLLPAIYGISYLSIQEVARIYAEDYRIQAAVSYIEEGKHRHMREEPILTERKDYGNFYIQGSVKKVKLTDIIVMEYVVTIYQAGMAVDEIRTYL